MIVKMLDTQVRAYHRRQPTDDYLYIFFDGVRIKVRSSGKEGCVGGVWNKV